MRFGRHRFSETDELDSAPASFEAIRSASEHLLSAPEPDRFEKLSIGHIRESVPIAVDGHQFFRTAVIRRNLLIADRPAPKIERSKAKRMAGPAE
jgi:hypothetical protein